MPGEDKTPQMMAKYWSNFLPGSMKVHFFPSTKSYEVWENDQYLKGSSRPVERVRRWRKPVRVWCHIVKRIRKDRGDPDWYEG